MGKIVNVLLVLATMVAAVSCVTEEPWQRTSGQAAEGEAQVVLRLRTPGNFSKPGARALGHDDESAIDDIYVLAFDVNNNLKRIIRGKDVVITPGSSAGSGSGSFAVALAASSGSSDTYKLVVLANASRILGKTIGFDASSITDKSYGAIIARIYDELSGPMYTSGGRIPMWGETAQIVIQTGITPPPVSLKRAICRIDVGTGKATCDSATHDYSWDGKDADDNDIPFELTSVHVICPNKKYALVQGVDERDNGKPTILKGTTAFTETESLTRFAYTGLSGNTQRSIYIPEADIVMDDTGKPGDKNHTKRMAIVVGGKYNGQSQPTYYRVDFMRNGALINAVRNHLYQFCIKGVSGEGHPDVLTAYKSISMNMAVEVLEWNETEIGFIMYDGQNYLGISPTEFSLSREKGVGNKFTVKTDVPKGWKIDGTSADTPDSGVPADWIKNITPLSGDTPGKLYPVTFDVEENNTGAARTAWIHVVAGRLDYLVKVVQDKDAKLEDYAIIITDGEGMEVSELFFIGGSDEIPAPKVFNVQWSPSGKTLDMKLVPASADPMVATSDPTIGPAIDWDAAGKTYTISPAAIGAAPPGNDFFERTAKVYFEMETPLGSVSKILNLRQGNYKLIPQIEPVVMNGKPHTFHVRANFTWKAELVSASSPDAPSFTGKQIVKVFDTQYGGNNTGAGDPVTITCHDFFTNYDPNNPKIAIAKVKFSRLKDNGQWVDWATYDIDCYAAALVGESNSYMINSAKPVPILIPVSHISRAISQNHPQEKTKLPHNWMPSDCSNLKAAVLWSDNNAFGDAGVVKTVEYNGAADYADGKIVVVPGTGIGNAVIILYADNNGTPGYQQSKLDRIYWSWHIWKSDYFPYRTGTYPGLNPVVEASGNGGRWMDRNVGAMDNGGNFFNSVGLYYQWGKKDPYPKADESNKIIMYSPPGVVVYHAFNGVQSNNNLAEATANPLRYYRSRNKYDWYASEVLTDDPLKDIWGGDGKGKAKSVYDPCPEGYRVPRRGEWLTNGWTFSPSSKGARNPGHGGYYPHAGFRPLTYTENFGKMGYYWQASMEMQKVPYGCTLYLYGAVNNAYLMVRSYSANLRCVKDD